MKLSQLVQATKEKPDPVQSSGILFVCSGKVLLVQRGNIEDQSETWTTPGGFLQLTKQGTFQHPWASAKREVEEELGSLPPGITKAVKMCRHQDRPNNHVYTTYIVELPPQARATWKPHLNLENKGWKWVGPQDIKKLKLHKGLSKVFRWMRGEDWWQPRKDDVDG